MFDFMKYRFIYYIISGILVLTSIASLAMWQLQPSIDFTGGSLVEVKYESDLGKEKERQLIEDSFREKEIETFVIQQTGNSSWIIRVKPIDEIKKNEILTLLNEKAGVKILEQRFEVVGPTIGKEITNKTFMAIILGISCILIYIAWTERKVSSKIASWKFGLAAIIALLHDSIITIGVFSLLGHFLNVEVDLLFVTAVLTIMSFSVHDTIVVFDRIKESFRKQSQLDLVTAVNDDYLYVAYFVTAWRTNDFLLYPGSFNRNNFRYLFFTFCRYSDFASFRRNWKISKTKEMTSCRILNGKSPKN